MMICGRVLPLASLALAFAPVLVLASCTERLPQESPDTPPFGTERATVTGRVVDTDGAALAGATVTVRATGERATADSNGAFVLDVPANTTLTLAASAPSMANTLLPQFVLSPGTSTSFTIPLLTSARLTNL